MSDFRFATAAEAEAAFYEAFERASLGDMMAVWADDGTLVCVHPMSARLIGRAAITDSWRQILGSGERMRFELGDTVISAGDDISVHWVHEHISVGDDRRSLIIATNVYRLGAAGWRMVAHHGSPGHAPQRPQPARKLGTTRMH